MSFDPVDVWGGAMGSLFKRLGLYISSVWMGAVIGSLSVIASSLVSGGHLDPADTLISVFLAPAELFNAWFLLSFAVLAIGIAYFAWSEDPGYWAWVILAFLISLGVKLGEGSTAITSWLPLVVGWSVWLTLLVMLITGVWFLRQYFINRWAVHMANVSIGNSIRRAGEEQRVRDRLVASRPPGLPSGMQVEVKPPPRVTGE